MRLGDLAAQHQSDPRAAGLGREERNEQIRRLRRPRSVVVDPQVEAACRTLPADHHAAAAVFERGLGAVAQQIDEQLLELIAIGVHGQVGSGLHRHRHARLESSHAVHQRLEHDRGLPGRRQLGETRVGGGETAEGFGARSDHLQTASQVVSEVDRRGVALQQCIERSGQRLDGAERVPQLVPDDANQALPGLAFLLAERTAHVGDHEQVVALTAEAERRAAHFPASGAAGQVEGKTMINDVCRVLNINEDTFDGVKGESESLGGLVMELAGEIPGKEELIISGDFEFRVMELEKNRLKKIKVSINSV